MRKQKQTFRHNYTPEEIKFITKKIVGRSYAEMTALFNDRFNLRGKKKITFEKMHNFITSHKLRNGLDGRYGSDHASPKRSIKGWFKPEHKSWNKCPVGTEKISPNGRTWVKVSDPNTWKSKHAVIWEKAHGKVPKGCVIIFADRDKSNVSLDNLLMVSKRELVVMNRYGLIAADRDLTRIGRTIAQVKLLVVKREKEAKKRREG
jgi:hypothetical protein